MGRKPLSQSQSAKKPPLTLAQISAYDDILTDALVDHVFYWTVVPKNRPSYHASRGMREEEITKIITTEIIVNRDLDAAETKLLATAGLRKFYSGLKTDGEKTNFRAHMRRYMQIYCNDCAWEVNSTNRYTIISHEAAITARRFIARNETIKYLAGIQVVISPEEEREISVRKKDFSIVVSARSKCASLFMGPARFANHDCNANAKLMTTGQAGIEIVATRNIEPGEEITVTYSASYFGDNNCECLCKTCEDLLVNGWAQSLDGSSVKLSIESCDATAAAASASVAEGYSLRRRRGRRGDDMSASASASRGSSVAGVSGALTVTEDIRPKVVRTGRRRAAAVELGVEADVMSVSSGGSRGGSMKRGLESPPESPPESPAKRARSGEKEKEQEKEKEKEKEAKTEEDKVQGPLTPQSQPGQAEQGDEAEQTKAEQAEQTKEQTQEETKEQTKEQTQEETKEQTKAVESKQPAMPIITQTPPHRVTGDYTLTPLLLCEPETAWITCTICAGAFVQHNAYYTKSACPRCERHSKLYGYVWPKTERAGAGDAEPRVLDHRTVHRFLRAEDELRARGRKVRGSVVR